jgi:hypothetical protein
VEKLLHTLSDQQLIAGFSLIFALNKQACSIASYYYDLVCAMLLMSLTTHLNALIGITKFIHKGRRVASFRGLAILAQIVFTSMIFQSRDSPNFPSQPGSLAIMPACCFMNLNGSDWLGFSDAGSFLHQLNTTGNVTDVISTAIHDAGKSPAFSQYIALVVFLAFAALIAVVNWLEAKEVVLHHCVRYLNIGTSGIMSIASLALVVWAFLGYQDLRSGMEVSEWYNSKTTTDTWSFAQILPLALMASSSITVLMALTGMWCGVFLCFCSSPFLGRIIVFVLFGQSAHVQD